MHDIIDTVPVCRYCLDSPYYDNHSEVFCRALSIHQHCNILAIPPGLFAVFYEHDALNVNISEFVQLCDSALKPWVGHESTLELLVSSTMD